MATSNDLPQLPAKHVNLARHIAEHPETPMVEIMEPYRQYEARLREVYAQDRQNPILSDPHLNVVPLFNEETAKITTRARDLSAESEEEKSKYIMALPDDKRRPHGSPATVATFADFQHNFNVFSESSLVEVDWNNVVAAGSSVVNCLLPVPKEFNTSKRKLREYYHEKFCPASDVDLFLYGLTHDEAIEKIKQIERAVKDALLNEVTVVRTKYAITIASQYPVRHIQIVLRVYKSVSEILTGFDIDAAGGAYDGKQVYVTPRALGSFITQINHVDLSRRSPSYENRLSKYSHRNFEVYWPDLNRSRVDPTIFERSFQRTLGLARLLVLERLPTNHARESYLNKRRQERGRPTRYRNFVTLHGNIKDSHEDEVADWLSEEDISNYHTFTVPYGQKFNAKRIEKLCYTRDLLLNAEWNQPKDRQVYLHRHPAFFGRVQDVIEDCCGCCPHPVTPDEIEAAEKEAEIYISGKVSFLIDDPGRQQIGSFNPLTEQDWTDMAYVGNTARLCQSIVDGDVDEVLDWLSQDGADPNQRDYTGRAPLHLAVVTSTPDVVKCLVDHGARLTARLADGKTALHLAAARGNTEMIKLLMEKSIENEEAEEERQSRRRRDRMATAGASLDGARRAGDSSTHDETDEHDEAGSESDSDGELVDGEQTEAEVQSIATGSFVKVKKGAEQGGDDIAPDESQDDPDYYQIDVLAWDTPCSPLHLAIVEGHEDAVKLLCDYGADSILPVKFLTEGGSSDTEAILTLSLALTLPKDKAISMARLLLKLGATSSQADARGCTAFYRYVDNGERELVDTLLENDPIGVNAAINHIIFSGYSWNVRTTSPLHAAVESSDSILLLKLLNAGALTEADFNTWLKSAKASPNHSANLGDLKKSQETFRKSYEPPIFAAIFSGNSDAAMRLLENGVDVNSMNADTRDAFINTSRWNYTKGVTVLDAVRDMTNTLMDCESSRCSEIKAPVLRLGLDTHLDSIDLNTYKHWVVSQDVKSIKEAFARSEETYEKEMKDSKSPSGQIGEKAAIQELLAEFKSLENKLIESGAKSFSELHPEVKCDKSGRRRWNNQPDDETKPYTFEFQFTHDKDMDEERRDGYIRLMEAAWTGDLDRMKALTLQAWGKDSNQAPLKMAIFDNNKSSPFSVSISFGRFDVAWAILDIIKAQWSAPDEDQLRYKMKGGQHEDNSEYDSEEDYSEDSDSETKIVSEIVDKNFTIEDIGQVSMQVKSHITPLQHVCSIFGTILVENGKPVSILNRSTLFRLSLDRDDAATLKQLLDMAQKHGADSLAGDDGDDGGERSARFTFPEGDFRWAVENGKSQLLAVIIKKAGAGIPLDHIVKKTGVEAKQKPRFYQGLTVYGKKRKDWANAGRNVVVRTSGIQTPPLLHAALGGSVDSVEFFLSDKPHRLYNEFGKSKAAREDFRLRHLNQTPGVFDRAISKWLEADNDLAIHCAVLSRSDESLELLEYLIQNCPEYMEKKNSDGETPIMVACRLGRVDLAKALIDGGADQSTRNLKGENIIHAALAEMPTAPKLRPMLDLFDTDLRVHLFAQRKNLSENGTTPLHSWIYNVSESERTDSYYSGYGYQYGSYHRNNTYRRPGGYKNLGEVATMVELLLEYSKGSELDMLNGAGDTCLHTATSGKLLSVVRILIKFNPQLLYRENAVGRTPAELAKDEQVGQAFAKPHSTSFRNRRQSDKIVDDRVDRLKNTSNSADSRSSGQLKAKLEMAGLNSDYSAADASHILAQMGLGEYKGVKQSHLETKTTKQVMWDLVSTTLAKHSGRRRLVSLNEANDVARRLGEKHTGSRYFSVESRKEEDEEAASDDGKNDQQKPSDFSTTELNKRLHNAWIALTEEEDEK